LNVHLGGVDVVDFGGMNAVDQEELDDIDAVDFRGDAVDQEELGAVDLKLIS
jgi:hypothetical protein